MAQPPAILPPKRYRPTRAQLLDGIDQAEMQLTEMIGRWWDDITPEVRAELLPIKDFLLELLVWEKRR